MAQISAQLDLSALISSALSLSQGVSALQSESDLYLLFTSTGLFISDEPTTITASDQLISLQEGERSRSAPYSELEEEVIKGLHHLKESESLSLSSTKYRYQRSSWRGFLIDPRVYRWFSERELFGTVSCMVRLVRLRTVAFNEGVERRLKTILKSDGDLLVKLESRDDLLAVSEWFLSQEVLEESGRGEQIVLPEGWRWLSVTISSQRSVKASINPSVDLKLVPKRCSELSHLGSQYELEQYSWMINITEGGEVKHAVNIEGAWHNLDQLSDQEWAEATQLTLRGIKADLDVPKRTVLSTNDQATELVDERPHIVDYDEALSGIGSEASTMHQPVILIDEPSVSTVRATRVEDDNTDGEVTRSISPEELHEANQKIQARQREKGDQEDFTPLSTKDTDLHVDDVDSQFIDEDQSAILDISLSDLPLKAEELEALIFEEEEPLEPKADREARALQEVREVLSSGSSLSINRSFISSSKTNINSIVTSQSAEEESVVDDSFVYQTLNQRSSPPAKAETEESALPTFNERSPIANAILNADFIHSDETAEITTELQVELDNLPTRIDLSTEDVIGALDKERQDAVTRVVMDNPTKAAPLITQDVLQRDELDGIEGDTKIRPQASEQMHLNSARSETDRSSDAFSREETAKLRVRDFDMLTDIKEIPQLAPQAPERPKSQPPMRATPPPPPPQMSTPPRQTPPPSHTLPIFSQPSSAAQHHVQSAKHSPQERARASKSLRDRRSFSDVIRSLTAKNKPHDP